MLFMLITEIRVKNPVRKHWMIRSLRILECFNRAFKLILMLIYNILNINKLEARSSLQPLIFKISLLSPYKWGRN